MDLNTLAHKIVDETTAEKGSDAFPESRESPANGEDDSDEAPKNPAAVALGRLGGQKGGKARAAKLTPERRREIAKLAAEVRWKKAKP